MMHDSKCQLSWVVQLPTFALVCLRFFKQKCVSALNNTILLNVLQITTWNHQKFLKDSYIRYIVMYEGLKIVQTNNKIDSDRGIAFKLNAIVCNYHSLTYNVWQRKILRLPKDRHKHIISDCLLTILMGWRIRGHLSRICRHCWFEYIILPPKAKEHPCSGNVLRLETQ